MLFPVRTVSEKYSFSNVASCDLLEIYRRFGGIHFLCLSWNWKHYISHDGVFGIHGHWSMRPHLRSVYYSEFMPSIRALN